MAMKHIGAKVHRTWRALRRDRKGQVALLFALALIPVIGLVGAAVDYSRASSAKVSLQAALDSTALMLSKEVGPNTSQEQIDQKANDFFKALFIRPEAKNVVITAKYDAPSGTLVMNASGSLDTALIRVLGHKSMAIGTSATIRWGTNRLRVALVLDNTGSMKDDGKMDALKKATNDLLDTLKTAAVNKEDIYVSIVPFSRSINVGKANATANWIDWSLFDAKKVVNSANGYSCVWGFCQIGGSWVVSGTVLTHDSWSGCVKDRGLAAAPGKNPGPDQTVVTPNINKIETLFPATPPNVSADCPPAEVMGLTTDWDKMKQLVKDMNPNGNTNQPIGLVWGWMSLVGGGPFTVPAKDANYAYDQVIILMSDGLNTEDRWYTSQGDIDARMYDKDNGGVGTCKNVKDANVAIYTIHVNTGGDPESKLLKNCASQDKFYYITKSDQMTPVFKQIGSEIAKLRIAK
jgi:Flp pilus assembly protein TadG